MGNRRGAKTAGWRPIKAEIFPNNIICVIDNIRLNNFIKTKFCNLTLKSPIRNFSINHCKS